MCARVCVSVCECVHVLRVLGLGGGLQCPLSHVCLLTQLFVALAFPRKMTSVYHCDWHCLASPFLFFFVPTHTPACPPPLPAITLHRSPETCTLIGYTQPAGTDCIRRRRSNCISVLYDCHTSVLLWSPQGPGEAGRRTGAAKSHVCAVNARRCSGSTTGKLLHCAGDGVGMPGSAGKSLAPGNDEAQTGWQEAAGCRETHTSRINVPYQPYLCALRSLCSAVVKLQLF